MQAFITETAVIFIQNFSAETLELYGTLFLIDIALSVILWWVSNSFQFYRLIILLSKKEIIALACPIKLQKTTA